MCAKDEKGFVPHLDFLTFALEALAYTSRRIVTPEYYDRTLQLKRFEDDESPAILDVIFSNKKVDISIVYNWADCIQWYNNMLFADSGDIISYVDRRKDVFDSEMQETLGAILALD